MRPLEGVGARGGSAGLPPCPYPRTLRNNLVRTPPMGYKYSLPSSCTLLPMDYHFQKVTHRRNGALGCNATPGGRGGGGGLRIHPRAPPKGTCGSYNPSRMPHPDP